MGEVYGITAECRVSTELRLGFNGQEAHHKMEDKEHALSKVKV